MKLKVPPIPLIFGAGVVQAMLGDSISVFGVRPSLMLIAVYALSIIGGAWKGLLYGAFGGFVMDCLSGGMLGLFMSGYALVGYAAGAMGKRVFNVGENANFVGMLSLSLAQGTYTAVVLNTLFQDYSFWGGLLWSALPQAFMTAVAGALILWMFKEEIASRVPWLRIIRNIQVRM